MSEGDSSDNKNGPKPKSYGGILWFLSIILISVGVIFTVLGGWIAAVIGFILLLFSSVSLASEWSESGAGSLGIWLLLVMGGLTFSWGIILAACSHVRL